MRRPNATIRKLTKRRRKARQLLKAAARSLGLENVEALPKR